MSSFVMMDSYQEDLAEKRPRVVVSLVIFSSVTIYSWQEG